MKKIEEVIKAYVICMSYSNDDDDCKGCPYAENGEPKCYGADKKDALYYLKEYKKVIDVMHEHGIGSVWGITLPDPEKVEGKPDIDGCANMPLTWEELKQMDGKPIWISDFGWDIADGVGDDTMNTAFGITYKRVNMNIEWQAYRKEKE